MKLLNVQSSPTSQFFLPLRSILSSQHPVLKESQVTGGQRKLQNEELQIFYSSPAELGLSARLHFIVQFTVVFVIWFDKSGLTFLLNS